MTFQLKEINATSKSELYSDLAEQLRALLEGENDFIANSANFVSLLFYSLPDLNWAGIYLFKDNQLVLGPFQGKPACVRIGMGNGVCGTAAQLRQTVLVENVHEFPGHIACDAASKSELVVPIIRNESLVGVVDLDSPNLARFTDEDAQGMNQLVKIFLEAA